MKPAFRSLSVWKNIQGLLHEVGRPGFVVQPGHEHPPPPVQSSHGHTMKQFMDIFSLPEMTLLSCVNDYFMKHNIDYEPVHLYKDVKVRAPPEPFALGGTRRSGVRFTVEGENKYAPLEERVTTSGS